MTDLVAGVSTRMLRPVIQRLIAVGVPVDPVLRQVGLEAAVLKDRDARIPHSVVIHLWQAAAAASGDYAFGLHTAETLNFSLFEVQAYAVLSSATLQEGIERACRYQRLQHDATRIALDLDAGGGEVTHSVPGGRMLPRHPAEFFAAVFVRMARHASGRAVVPLAVRFAHAPPVSLVEHLRIFGVAPEFGHLGFSFSVRFSHEDLSAPLLNADPTLQALLDRHAADLLAALPKVSSFSEQVRSVIAKELVSGNPSLESIADKLGMSSRSISRRLFDEGTSHRALLDDVRQELAGRYLSEQNLAVGEVAFLLGFSEPSAFHRAFKRWYGVTPAAYRQRAVEELSKT